MENTRVRYVLGLDGGTASLGWALTKQTEQFDEGEKSYLLTDVDILDGGVRLFDEMLNPKNANTLNSERREKRGARRIIERRKRRLVRLLHLLRSFGFINPVLTVSQIKQSFVEIEKEMSIYQLRKKALDQKLSEMELVKVIFHLARRRGFRSNRKEKKKEEELQKIRAKIRNETGEFSKLEMLENFMRNDENPNVPRDQEKKQDKVYTAIEALKYSLELTRSRTLGEYFADKEARDKAEGIGAHRIRGIYLDRAMIAKELDEILKKQGEFYPILFACDHVKRYRSFWQQLRDIKTHADMLSDTILEPRPLKDQSFLIGNCPYFPSEKRIPRSSLLFQEFEIRSKINNMRYGRVEKGCSYIFSYQKLSPEEKEKIFDLAWSSTKVPWDAIKKELNLDKTEYQFNYESKEKKAGGSQSKEFNGGTTNSGLTKVLGKEIWNQWDLSIKEDLVALYSLGELKFGPGLEAWLAQYYPECPEHIYEALYALDLNYANDYASYSRKMLELVLPLVKNGMQEATSFKGETREKLGFIDTLMLEGKLTKSNLEPALLTTKEINEITNPRIKKMLFETKKLLKALEKKYGQTIREEWFFTVEMAREMRKDEYTKQQDISGQLENQNKRERARNLGARNSSDELKYILWLESEHSCIYCAKSIGQSELFSDAVEIEHIVPFARLVDDSQMNKTIACVACNKAKSNKLPWEKWGQDKEDWEIKETRWKNLAKSKHLPWIKLSRLMWTSTQLKDAAESFTARQMSETRYGSVEIRKMLERWIGETSVHQKRIEGEEYEVKRVRTTKGAYTSRIRQILRLNLNTAYDDYGVPKDNYLLARIESKKDNMPWKHKAKKERLDHRHHFVDAVAMTLIGPSFEQRLSHMARAEEVIKKRFQSTGIWSDEFAKLISQGISFENMIAYIRQHAKNTAHEDDLLQELNNPKTLLRKTVNVYEEKKSFEQRRGLYSFLLSDLHDNFIQQLNERLETMIVSQALTHKISGELHQDTCHGVLHAIPVSYLDEERIMKLSSEGYLSQEVIEKLDAYVEEHKFINNGSNEIKRTKAKDKYLWAFRRGRQKEGGAILPPPVELAKLWDETVCGKYKKDYVPLQRPLYTKSSKTPGKSVKNIADIRLKNQIKPLIEHAETLKAQWETLRNFPEYKNKKIDWQLQDLSHFRTEKLYEAVREYCALHPESSVESAIKYLVNSTHMCLSNGQYLKSVLLLQFATKKFTPLSPEDRHKAFATGSNHHIAIFKREKEGEAPMSVAVLVSTVDAAERARRQRIPVVCRNLRQEDFQNWGKNKATETNIAEWRFFCSLMKNDYVELEDGNIYRVTDFDSNGNVRLTAHFFGGNYKDHKAYQLRFCRRQGHQDFPAAIQLAFARLRRIQRKIYVDILGQIVTGHD